MDNFILKYYQQIQDGSVVVGEYIKLVMNYLVKGLEDGSFFFDQKKANKAIKFIETKCHHTEGKLAPKCLKLEDWQKAFISAIFGIVDKDGLRQFREIVLIVARKNGKSLLSTAVAEFALFADDEYGARGFCVAPKLEQADIIYDTFWQSVSLDNDLKQRAKHRKSDIYIAESNSSMKKIAFNAKKSDGFNPHICICDEFASWSPQQGLSQFEVMRSAMGAREQPIMLAISTAGYVNDGIYDELLKRSTRFLKGDSKETRLLPFIYMIDDVEKWNDINELRKSNPNLGVSVKVDYLLEEIAIAEGSLSKKAEFLCKYANIKQNSSTAWLETSTVEKACGEHLRLEDFRENYCVCGIDLSQCIDLTAVTTVIEKDGTLFTFCQYFMPKEKIEDATIREGLPYNIYVQRGLITPSGENFVDYKDVFDYIRMLIEKYQILPLVIGYDRYSSQYLIQDLTQYGARCDDVYQGENLSSVIDFCEGSLKDGTIQIGDNDVLKMHLLNSALKRNIETGRKRLVKVNPTLHIDGVAALLDCLTVRQKYYAEIGEQLKNRR